MATFEVKIETLTVLPHPNADRLEIAHVGLYHIVVGKGDWVTGDKCFYIPEYSILPQPLIEALGLEGKLAGPEKNRVHPVKLRKELSQGVVAPLSFVSPEVIEAKGLDGDYAEDLGITKWEPVIPASMSGDVEAGHEVVNWIEIENLKKFPNIFTAGEPVVVTEKIHGTCSCFTVINPTSVDAKLIVTSKGLGAKRLALKESKDNLYWQMAEKYNLTEFGKFIAEKYSESMPVSKVAIFGETFGKVQDLTYGLPGSYGFTVFDIFVEGEESRWLNPDEVINLTQEFGIPHPPVLFVGEFSIEKTEELASGMEQVSGKEVHIREGVVIRPINRTKAEGGMEKIAKYVSEAYLTRKNGTEYN